VESTQLGLFAEENRAEGKPFIKWVGGKRQLLAVITNFAPQRYGRYHEPFLGGGAVFFHIRPERAVLSDSNPRLIRTYRGVRDDVEGVIRRLQTYPYERTFYDAMRARNIDGESDAELAAWFVYLNRTGYNGLYRVNSKNQFNVPFGRYVNPTICDAENLRTCSRALASADLKQETFQAILQRAERDDFVYFDPPYVPLSVTSSFTSYTSAGFSLDDQQRLRDVTRELKRRGVHVLLSNSSSPLVRELYAGFEIFEVSANRMVNSRPERRGKISELLIR
jgi:DNA adenine methylase